jgi:hypothetical protein
MPLASKRKHNCSIAVVLPTPSVPSKLIKRPKVVAVSVFEALDSGGFDGGVLVCDGVAVVCIDTDMI